MELQRRCGAGSTIESSLREPFDESVLVWHVATDLCFRRSGPPAGGDRGREVRARAISDYMAHLLRSRPEMLITGSRRHLLAEAMEDVERIVRAAAERRPGLDGAALLATTVQEAGRSSACRVPSHPRRVQALRRADGAAAGGDALGGDVPRQGSGI